MWTFIMVAGFNKGFRPPQTWQGVTVSQLSPSNIGPHVVFDEDGQVHFADDFDVKKYLYDMVIGKLAFTFTYVYGSPVIAMLGCWTFSMVSLESACIFYGMVTGNLCIVSLIMFLLYRRGVRRTKERKYMESRKQQC